MVGAVYTVYEAGRQADILELAVRKMTALAEAEAESDVSWKQESDAWETHDRESAAKILAVLCRIEALNLGERSEPCVGRP